MSRRLLDWPRDLHWMSREPLTGPRAAGAGSNEGLTGFVQSFASPFGLWRWSFSFPPLRGEAFRRYRGTVLALHGGANAIRVPFCDPDGLGWSALGVTLGLGQPGAGVPWSNGLPWSNGQNWRIGRPWVALAAAAAQGDDIVTLADEWFGHGLDIGDMLGFTPFHFGLYFVTERLDAGRYRIWPPLRKALTTADFATLEPVMAMKLESENSAGGGRGATMAEGLTMTLIEVEDADIRDYYA